MVSYKPLWHTLLTLDLKKMDLVKRGTVSTATLAKLGRNEYVALEVLDRICTDLGCPIEAVIEIKAPQG
ncbi:helix-turn-helix transcriptional regulator [uncultured Dysosmobacter sp.]|uniref:helix-turn-helix domain-containing protein n=1 Tax=uncultured Dysosmobacter sp. TaxID=2591384 RepID=UPI0026020D5A|nr:helix-turn-helix domain-containing protein [uncultured Dysosmobacter sp.]